MELDKQLKHSNHLKQVVPINQQRNNQIHRCRVKQGIVLLRLIHKILTLTRTLKIIILDGSRVQFQTRMNKKERA